MKPIFAVFPIAADSLVLSAIAWATELVLAASIANEKSEPAPALMRNGS